MKLHDLQVGQRFTFTDKHRGKVFEVTHTDSFRAAFIDVATKQLRYAWASGKTFRMDVELETTNRAVELTPADIEILKSALVEAYLRACEIGKQSTDGEEINALLLKLTGLPGRRTVLTEGE